MTKIEYEEITLTSVYGTTPTSVGTYKNVYLEQIIVDPDDSAVPQDSWDLDITENTTGRSVYSNAAMPNKTITTAVIRSGAVGVTGSAISNSFEKIPLRYPLNFVGSHMSTAKTAVVKVWYKRP